MDKGACHLLLWLLVLHQVDSTSHIPSYIAKHIKTLKLQRMHRQPPARAFCHIAHLTTVEVTNSHIPSLNKNTFKCLDQLMYLRLCNCKLQNIPDGAFKVLKNLHKLSLSGEMWKTEMGDDVFVC